MANVVLLRKESRKWRMCVDFTKPNSARPKYLYPLSNIDRLIVGSSSYKMLTFMDAYLGKNWIKKDLIDTPKTMFMSNYGNFITMADLLGIRMLAPPKARLIYP